MGELARLSDGRTMGRTWGFDQAGNPLFSYGEWDQEKKQATIIPTPDPVDAIQRIVEAVEGKFGLHTLPHNPEPTEEDRFLDQWPTVGAKLGLSTTKPVTFLFDPGRVSYPKAGITDVRTWFNKHVTGDHGIGQHDPTPLSLEEQFCLSMLPSSRQSDHAIHTGRGVIRSCYGDVGVVTILSPSRRTTLIWDKYSLEHYQTFMSIR